MKIGVNELELRIGDRSVGVYTEANSTAESRAKLSYSQLVASLLVTSYLRVLRVFHDQVPPSVNAIFRVLPEQRVIQITPIPRLTDCDGRKRGVEEGRREGGVRIT